MTNYFQTMENGRLVVYVTDDLNGKTRYEIPYKIDINALLEPLIQRISNFEKNTPRLRVIESEHELDNNAPDESIYIVFGNTPMFYMKKDGGWKVYEIKEKKVETVIQTEPYKLPAEIMEHISKDSIHITNQDRELWNNKLDGRKSINGLPLRVSPTLYGKDIKLAENDETILEALHKKAGVNDFYTKEQIDSYFEKKELSETKRRRTGKKWKGKEIIIQDYEGTIPAATKAGELATILLAENVEELIDARGTISDGESSVLIDNYSPTFWSCTKVKEGKLIVESESTINRTKKTGKYHIRVEFTEL
jgi:hypothetical protein